MRGRINLTDLYNMPFNIVHELYYYTFNIKEAREEARKEEEEQKKKEEEKAKEREKSRKRPPTQFDRPLSPAALAEASKKMKSQRDEEKQNEENNRSSELSLPSNIDTGDIVDLLEEAF